MRTLKLYFYGLLILLFVIFVLQNYTTLTYSVALRFNLGFISFVSIPLPLFLVAPLFFFTGLFLATIVGMAERRRLSKQIKQLKSLKPISKPEPPPDPHHEPKSKTVAPFTTDSFVESQPEIKPEVDERKKPDEGTIKSSSPLYKK